MYTKLKNPSKVWHTKLEIKNLGKALYTKINTKTLLNHFMAERTVKKDMNSYTKNIFGYKIHGEVHWTDVICTHKSILSWTHGVRTCTWKKKGESKRHLILQLHTKWERMINNEGVVFNKMIGGSACITQHALKMVRKPFNITRTFDLILF